MKHNLKTAAYEILPDSRGNRYRFFCALSGAAVCTTRPVRADTPEEECRLAWELEGKQNFNQCHRCGRWVSDVMYNADVLQCVDCAPWEEVPKFCSHCGADVSPSETHCHACGAKLRYGGGKPDEPTSEE